LKWLDEALVVDGRAIGDAIDEMLADLENMDAVSTAP
jgi:hypothetical protein